MNKSLQRLAQFLLMAVLAISLGFHFTLPTEAASTYYDDTNPALTYTGNWTSGTNWPNAYNTTVKWTQTSGSQVSFSFTGSSITRIYTMASNRGKADIYIDGVFKEQMNDYSSITHWQSAKTWSVTAGNHTISVRWASGNPAGVFIDTDAFVVDMAVSPNEYLYDDGDHKLKFIGNWTSSSGWLSAWENTETWSNIIGNAVSFTFSGDAVTYTYAKAFNRGKASITIDGVSKGDVDLYSAQAEWRNVSRVFGHWQEEFSVVR